LDNFRNIQVCINTEFFNTFKSFVILKARNLPGSLSSTRTGNKVGQENFKGGKGLGRLGLGGINDQKAPKHLPYTNDAVHREGLPMMQGSTFSALSATIGEEFRRQ
jgi:hypothetical protein